MRSMPSSSLRRIRLAMRARTRSIMRSLSTAVRLSE